jgi:antagonist of KipI
MSIVVIKQGILDTIQDEGRFGYQHLGINPNGCMDEVAATIANMLAGNDRGHPVIELHFPAATLQFDDDYLIAFAGADFQPTINNKTVPLNTPVWVTHGSTLKFAHVNKGSRCYMAIQGTWDLDIWKNSYSTNLKASVGGYEGRALRKNDVLKVKNGNWKIENGTSATSSTVINSIASSLYLTAEAIRCVDGNEYNLLSDEAKKTFASSSFQISVQSDRMGYRLQGNELRQTETKQLLSSAVTRGTVQLLPSGQLIVLMADHQTTGGYPKVAHVISSDFPTLAQMRPNEKLRFQLVTHDEAEEAYIKQQELLQQLENEIVLCFKESLSARAPNLFTEESYKEDGSSLDVEEAGKGYRSSEKSPASTRQPARFPDTNERISSSIYLDTPTSGITRKVIYSLEDKILEVELKEGTIYQYLHFPFDEWTAYKDEIVTGKSSGQFYSYIAKKYDYREVRLN